MKIVKLFFLFFVSTFLISISCKHKKTTKTTNVRLRKETVMISIRNAEHVELKKKNFEVTKNTTWSDVERLEEIASLKPKTGWELSGFSLKKDVFEGIPLSYKFSSNTDVYVHVKEVKNEPPSPPIPPVTKVIISIKNTEHVELKKESFEVVKNSIWGDVKKLEEIASIKAKTGWELLGFSLKKDVFEGIPLSYKFSSNTDVYVHVKEVENEPPSPPIPPVAKVTISMKNIEHVELKKESFEVAKNSIWGDVKKLEEIASIKAKTGWELLGFSLKKNVFEGIPLSHKFSSNTDIYVYVKKVKKTELTNPISIAVYPDPHIQWTYQLRNIRIEKGSTWEEVKEEINSYIEYDEEKFLFLGWKLEPNVASVDIEDNHVFNETCGIYCFAKLKREVDISQINELEYREMQEIIPPIEGIEGHDSQDYIPYSTVSQSKGVFIAGRTVKISPYKIAKYELTYELWELIYEWAIKHDYVFCSQGYANRRPTDEQNLLMPVTKIFWHDAVVWCNAYTELSNGSDAECVYRVSEGDRTVIKDATKENVYTPYYDKTKKGFRLPTEAEWEFAARFQKDEKNAELYGDVYLTKLDSLSGAVLPIPYKGLQPSRLPKELRTANGRNIKYDAWKKIKEECLRVSHFNYKLDDTRPPNLSTLPYKGNAVVGEKREPNALGIFDMGGNVCEYCFDAFDIIDINDCNDPIGKLIPDEENQRVVRGGHSNRLWEAGSGFRSICTKSDANNRAYGIRLAQKL